MACVSQSITRFGIFWSMRIFANMLSQTYAPARARHPCGSGGRGRGAEIPRRSGPAARVAFHQRDLAGVMGGHGCAGAEGGRTPSPFSTVIAGLDPAIHRPWMNGFLHGGSGKALGMTTPGTVTSVRYLTQAPVGLLYGAEVAERSTMVVGPLPRPSGRFLPRLGPAAPACGASFVSAPRQDDCRALARAKKSAPASGPAREFHKDQRVGSNLESRRLGASGTFFQPVRLSAMILVDCSAAWLKVAYSTISRCTRAAFVLQHVAERLQFGDQLVDLLHRGARHPLQQGRDVVGYHLAVAFRLAPQAGRHVAAHEFPDFPFHRRLHRILEIGGITRIEKGHV